MNVPHSQWLKTKSKRKDLLPVKLIELSKTSVDSTDPEKGGESGIGQSEDKGGKEHVYLAPATFHRELLLSPRRRLAEQGNERIWERNVARDCGNVRRKEKMVLKAEGNSTFSSR